MGGAVAAAKDVPQPCRKPDTKYVAACIGIVRHCPSSVALSRVAMFSYLLWHSMLSSAPCAAELAQGTVQALRDTRPVFELSLNQEGGGARGIGMGSADVPV